MEYYAEIDVSLKESSGCVVDAKGKVVREVKIASEPEAVVRYFEKLDCRCVGLGLRRGRDRNGCMRGLLPLAATLFCWRRT